MLARIKGYIQAWRDFKAYRKHGMRITHANISYVNYGAILKGKHVLITGGGSGIGLAVAKKFAACGAEVIITGRNEGKLRDAAKVVGDGSVKYLVWDVSDISLISEHLSLCRSIFDSQIDILINNAGIAPEKFFGEVDEVEWSRIYDNNLKGAFFLTQQIVFDWQQEEFAGYKKILNICSQGGFVGATYPYRMSKWDIRGFTEGLGMALVSKNIIVNGIAPGVVKTAMQQFSLNQGENLYTDQNPIRRVCLPEEIAELALFLCGDASNFIVGQTIVCDGGYTLK